jgi:hypothetical protein
VSLVVAEAQHANIIAYSAVGAVVVLSAAAIAFDLPALKSSAVLLTKNIRIVFSF